MTEYIKKAEAYRIALHDGSDACAARIQELPAERVICMTTELRAQIRKMRNELSYGAEYGAEYTLLEEAADLLTKILAAEAGDVCMTKEARA